MPDTVHPLPLPRHMPQLLVSTHPLLCCGCCGKKWICHAHRPTHTHTLPQLLLLLSKCCWGLRAYFGKNVFISNQTRPNPARPDQTRPEHTRPDQTRQLSECSACRHPLLPARCHSQRFRSWQFVSNLALIFHTGHRKLKCSHNGKSLACQKWRQFSRFSKGWTRGNTLRIWHCRFAQFWLTLYKCN